MRNLFIHIGTPKTGSTAIQRALENYRRSEGAKHVYYILQPPHACVRKIQQATLPDVSISDELNAHIVSDVGYSQANQETPSDVILSSEGFAGMPLTGFDNSDITASILKDATSEFNVRVIVYLRRQDQYVESMYTQTIHEGESHSFEGFLENFNDQKALDYSSLLASFESQFGIENMVVRSYEHAAKIGIVKDFGAVVGVSNLDQYSDKRKANPSYSLQAINIARSINSKLKTNEKLVLRWLLQEYCSKSKSCDDWLFDAAERMLFLDRFRVSNEEVARKYFDGKLEALFSNPEKQSSDMRTKATTGKIPVPQEISSLVLAMTRKIADLERLRSEVADYKSQESRCLLPRFKKLIRRVVTKIGPKN
mgnify:CR=1 FL=1